MSAFVLAPEEPEPVFWYRVEDDAWKRWACPTEEEAWESFRARKMRQLRILSAQVRHVERVLEMIPDVQAKRAYDGEMTP